MAGLNKVIKFSSQQSGAFNDINNIVTFNIPADGSYDLSSSYVELNCRMSAGAQDTTDAGTGTAVYIPELAWYNTPYQVNNSMFVRRAMLRTTRQGVLEDSLRRDILSANLVNYTHTSEELSSLGYKSGTQHMNYDGVVSSIWRSFNQGGTSASDAQSTRASTARSAPITIPLDQLLSLGMARQMPFGAMGGGQLELELNASITNSFADGNPVGWSTLTGPSIASTSSVIENVPSGTFAYGNSDAHPVQLTKKFVDRAEFPLHVGANVVIESTGGGGTGTLDAGAANLVITKIWFDADGTANLVMDQRVANLTAETLEDMMIAFAGALTPPLLTIDSANLVMKRIATPQPIQPQMTYLAWETEEYSQAGSTQLNHTFRLPANCMNALIMLPAGTGTVFDAPGSGISKLDDLATYRLSINNKPIVNRDVNVTNGIRNCLHYELLMRSFDAGSIPLKNIQEIQRLSPGLIADQVTGQNSTDREADIIGVPTEETATAKSLQVDLRTQGTEGAALLTNLVVFKQVVRTITI